LKAKVKKHIINILEQVGNTSRIRSIQFIITFSFTCVTILTMLIIGITLYSKFSKSSENNSVINTRQTIDQFVMGLDYYWRGIMDMSDSLNSIIYYSPDVKNERLPDQMEVVRGTRKDIVTVAVFSRQGEMVVGVPSNQLKSGIDITSQDWFMAPIKEPANMYVSSPHVQNFFQGQHSWVISLSREVTYTQNGTKYKGVLLSRGKNVISIEEELEHARNYLIIQKVRYKNKFTFKIEAEKGVLHCKTLKLILQPLIENALYHGIEYKVDEGHIEISVSQVDGKILFQVSDDGLGIPLIKLKTLLSVKHKEDSGVGVKNVHERLQLFYGKEYGLEIESELEVGTNIKLWIPIIEDIPEVFHNEENNENI